MRHQQKRKSTVLRWGANLLIAFGIVLLAYPGYTWVSAQYNQYQLRRQLTATTQPSGSAFPGWADMSLLGQQKFDPQWYRRPFSETEPTPAADNPVVLPQTPFDAADRPEKFPGALIDIPSLDLSAAVVYGVGASSLKKGPGLYPMASWPGEPGNVAIAAHRTTWGAWFRHVDQLAEGDDIYLTYEGMKFHYSVERVFITAANDWSVIEQTDDPVLTLTTCDPPGTSRNRLIVRAKLTDVVAADK